MAISGKVLENPYSKEILKFVETASDTKGVVLRFEATIKPGGHLAGPHAHPNQDEILRIKQGTLTVYLNGEKQIIKEGGVVTFPKTVSHFFENEGNVDVIADVQVKPALRLEEFLETMYGLAKDRKTTKLGVPGLFRSAPIMDEYKKEVNAPLIAKGIFRPNNKLINWIAQLLGFRKCYPEYITK